MGSALNQLVGSNNDVSFNDFYNAYRRDQAPNSPYSYVKQNPYGLTSRIENFFTGQLTSAEKEYDRYLTSKANKETFAREDSAVQRALKDYQAAGLNPYLLVNGGSQVSSPSSAAQKANHYGGSKEKKGSILGTALKLLAILAIKS